MKKLLFGSSINALLVVGCGSLNTPKHPSDLPLRYHNAQYDFSFFLPASWRGYSVFTERWEAPLHSADYQRWVGEEHGPIIVIRNPRWKAADRYQDIPITVFTRSQWAAKQQEYFFPNACGMIDEIWRNRKYVFGIYDRYDDLAIQGNGGVEVQGAEEAADIIKRNYAANR